MKRLLLATSLVAALALAAGIGYAAIPDSQGKIHACMLKATGTIRLIDTSLSAQALRGHCTAVESEVTWSQQGPAGATGPCWLQVTSDSTAVQSPRRPCALREVSIQAGGGGRLEHAGMNLPWLWGIAA